MTGSPQKALPPPPALLRARRLFWLLAALVVLLAASCLYLGDQLRQTRLEGTRSNLVSQIRIVRNSPRPGNEARILGLIESARQLRSGIDLRSEAVTVVALRLHDRLSRRADTAPVWANPFFPSVWASSADNIEFNSDGRAIRLFADNDCLEIPTDRPNSRPFFRKGIPLAPPRSIATNSTGKLVASITNETVALLAQDPEGHFIEFVHLSPPKRRQPMAVAWHPDGNRLAVACQLVSPLGTVPEVAGPLELWDIERLRLGLNECHLGWDAVAPARPLVTPIDWSWRYTVAAGALLIAAVAGGAISIHRSILRQFETAALAAQSRAAELEQARETLSHAEKLRALGTLAAGIAHDFNNLLSVISMARQLVDRSLRPTGAPKEHLQHIGQAVEQGRTLVRGILGYSRDTLTLSKSTRVADVIDEVVTLLGRQFLGGLAVQVENDPSCPRLAINRGRLEQILLNLIVNAAEAMQSKGRLEVCSRLTNDPGPCLLLPASPGPWVEVTVSDSGPGIPPQVLPRIFEPFFTTKTLGQDRGTGLGLATVWRISQEEGYGIRLETNPASGTRFHISIPVPSRPKTTAPDPESKPTPPQ